MLSCHRLRVTLPILLVDDGLRDVDRRGEPQEQVRQVRQFAVRFKTHER